MSAARKTARREGSSHASSGSTSASAQHKPFLQLTRQHEEKEARSAARAHQRKSEPGQAQISEISAIQPLVSQPKKHRRKTPRELAIVAAKEAAESRLYNLSLDVNNVRQQILDLTVRRDVLCTRLAYAARDARAKMLHQINRYFNGFRHGFPVDDLAHGEFVRSFAARELSIGQTGLGVEALLQQWQRYTEVFGIQKFVLTSSEFVVPWQFDGDMVDRELAVVKCGAEFHGVFTRTAVDAVFPNARNNLWRLLQILGHQMLCPMLFHIYLNTDGRMTRQDLTTDFFAALGTLLDGDLVMAARFMEGARIGEESMIGSPEVH